MQSNGIAFQVANDGNEAVDPDVAFVAMNRSAKDFSARGHERTILNMKINHGPLWEGFLMGCFINAPMAPKPGMPPGKR